MGGASVKTTNCPGGMGVTEQIQADIYNESMALWKSYPWAGVLFSFTQRDYDTNIAGECRFGIQREDGTKRPAWSVFQIHAKNGQTTTTKTISQPYVPANYSGLVVPCNNGYGVIPLYFKKWFKSPIFGPIPAGYALPPIDAAYTGHSYWVKPHGNSAYNVLSKAKVAGQPFTRPPASTYEFIAPRTNQCATPYSF